tara:strand:+ start:64 stop:195 length:132 start_codon:yes stop_codon:yes gene_type:complete
MSTEKQCDRIEEVCLNKNEVICIIQMAEKSEFSEKPIRHYKFP